MQIHLKTYEDGQWKQEVEYYCPYPHLRHSYILLIRSHFKSEQSEEESHHTNNQPLCLAEKSPTYTVTTYFDLNLEQLQF